SRSRFLNHPGPRRSARRRPRRRSPPTLINIMWLLGISAIVPTIQPTCRVRLGQQPAGQVVLVLSRHDEDDRSSKCGKFASLKSLKNVYVDLCIPRRCAHKLSPTTLVASWVVTLLMIPDRSAITLTLQ